MTAAPERRAESGGGAAWGVRDPRGESAPGGGMADVVEDGVGDRGDEERQQERERLAADDDDGDGAALLRARPRPQGERRHAGDERERGHQDGAEPVAVTL